MFVVKKNSEMVNKTFRLPVELVEQLTEVARMQDMSVNNLVLSADAPMDLDRTSGRRSESDHSPDRADCL